MKRLRVILLFLLLGAIVNVVVAVAACSFVQLRLQELENDRRDSPESPCWQIGRLDRIGFTFVAGNRLDEADLERMRSSSFYRKELLIDRSPIPTWSRLQSPPGNATSVVEYAWGWPARTFIGRWVYHGSDLVVEFPTVRFTSPKWIEKNTIIIPLIPLWRGFIVNSLLYGISIWYIKRLLVLTRRALRKRRASA